MSLSDAFNDDEFETNRENDAVLSVSQGYFAHYYDFLNRMVMTVYDGSTLTTTPFAQVDRETLIAMRDKLVELDGHPPELPAEAPAQMQPQQRKFNL
jgi:hypothetical protein